MKKKAGLLLVSAITLIAGFCNFLASIFREETLPKCLFLIAAICFFISAVGFLYTYLKSRKEK